jgi:hypothetical protein
MDLNTFKNLGVQLECVRPQTAVAELVSGNAQSQA